MYGILKFLNFLLFLSSSLILLIKCQDVKTIANGIVWGLLVGIFEPFPLDFLLPEGKPSMDFPHLDR